MTNLPSDDTRLLVLFGEMRGDLKSLLQANKELNARLSLNEAAVDLRLSAMNERVTNLESIKLRVAGFTTALGLGVGLSAAYFPEVFAALAALIGV